MLVGKWVDVAVTARNPDGSSATIPPGVLVCASDGPAIEVTPTGDTAAKITAKTPGVARATFSAPGFKPAEVTITVTDQPQLVLTVGPEQG